MENLIIYHACPKCKELFLDDLGFARHITLDHEQGFVDEADWTKDLPDSVFVLADSMISGDCG